MAEKRAYHFECQLFRSIHPATVVDVALTAHFMSSDATGAPPELILVRGNSLDVFGVSSTAASSDRRLIRKARFPLFGQVLSAAAVRFHDQHRDALMLSFPGARVSVVEFDPVSRSLSTCSLHDYAGMLAQEPPQGSETSILAADCDQRCAAFIHGVSLMILPFHQGAGIMANLELEALTDRQTPLPAAVAAGSSSRPAPLATDAHDVGIENNDYLLPSFRAQLKSQGFQRIHSVAFLHGCFQATLVLLGETKPSSTARMADRKDTCGLKALALPRSSAGDPSGASDQMPVVWSVDNLPLDCQKVVAVPEPIGGAIVFATNAIMYLSQSSRCCMATNRLAHTFDSETSLPLDEAPEGLCITLDCAETSFLKHDCVLLSLKGGELYLLRLVTDDDGQTVRRLTLERTGSTVLASCICTLEHDLIFLGSTLGDSLLVSYTLEGVSTGGQKAHPLLENGGNGDQDDLNDLLFPGESMHAPHEPALKKQRVEDEGMGGEGGGGGAFEGGGGEGGPSELDLLLGTTEAPSGNMQEDQDETSVADGEAAAAGAKPAGITLQVIDSLLNTGPVSGLTVGNSLSVKDEDDEDQVETSPLQAIACSGHGKNGAVCFIQTGANLREEVSFELPGCQALFTVMNHSRTEDADCHQFLLVSLEDSTMVVATGDDLEEVDVPEGDSSSFFTDGCTLFAGTIGHNGDHLVQVHSKGLLLLNSDSRKRLCDFDLSAGETAVAACAAHPFVAVLMSTGAVRLFKVAAGDTQLEELPSSISGMCSVSIFDGQVCTDTPNSENMHLLVLCSRAGSLEILTLPDCNVLFHGDHAGHGETVLSTPVTKEAHVLMDENRASHFQPVEACLTCMTEATSKADSGLQLYTLKRTQSFAGLCLVLKLANGDTNIYKSFSTEDDSQSVLISDCLNFEKAPQDIISRHGTLLRDNENAESDDEDDDFESAVPLLQHSWEGRRPLWVSLDKGYPRLVPLASGNSRVLQSRCIVGCRNPNFAFVYDAGDKLVCASWNLSTNMKGDTGGLSVSKLLLRESVHQCAWLPDHGLYFVVTSREEESIPETETMEWTAGGTQGDDQPGVSQAVEEDQEESVPAAASDPQTPIVTRQQYQLNLVHPSGVLLDSYALDTYEQVLDMKCCNLKCEGLEDDGLKGVIVLGTGYVRGEDEQCKGRILVFDVKDVVNDSGDGTVSKLKNLVIKPPHEYKGPISALAPVQGHLVVAIGMKILLYTMMKNYCDMHVAAFYDAQHYVVSISTAKQFVILGDIVRGVTFLVWRDSNKNLAMYSKDPCGMVITATEFITAQRSLGFLAADVDGNIKVLDFDPRDSSSEGGSRLMVRADFHQPDVINQFVRCRMQTVGRGLELKRCASYFGTSSGSVGFIAPITRTMHDRLHLLEIQMIAWLDHSAGLNPAAFRHVVPRRGAVADQPRGNVIDGDLIYLYPALPLQQKLALAQLCETTEQQLTRDLLEMQLAANIF